MHFMYILVIEMGFCLLLNNGETAFIIPIDFLVDRLFVEKCSHNLKKNKAPNKKKKSAFTITSNKCKYRWQ